MKQVIATAPKELTIVDVPKPELAAGEILVQTLVAGVCGSDLHAIQGLHPFVPLPYKPGHEVVGIIREIAPDVDGFSIGDRITVEPDLPCWDCKNCKNGNENLCERLQFFGCGYPQSGMSEFWTLSARRAHKVPDSFTDEAASLIEPLSTPIHAMKLATLGSKDLSGKTVVILGCGTIGLLTLVAAKYFNAKTIVMTDLLPNKRERALRLGADAVLDAGLAGVVDDVRALLGDSADVVFDCVALQPTVNQAIALADKGGTVVIVGVPEKDVSVPLPIIQDHQIRIQGSATYLPSDFKDAITLLGSGVLDVKEFVTAVFPWEQTQEAFESALLGDQVKVLIRFS